ncbi:phasin family protein [Magnetospirillum gryphiswaldense]|uniref:Phasin family protein n=1 Tax=Magnetospirillum gryphiswaldense (strain DSM 6361 / JCM 21280 / NBRC 15271 / MSR-1) TaxID=431944 RepID=V6F8B8_MAGGM|nr:phasin family protein [Magnetospirillum gryphiswaldense]AVM75201.1 Phasin protein [Magnetospirillum gryphiswaldense MSR-1]AVM79104.1 Phasin protein [Magnetospirillum gryphiswaldense]CDL00813.1 putative phasin family protein [Magnetospirillum gryphiswaldense MSR-1 v2]
MTTPAKPAAKKTAAPKSAAAKVAAKPAATAPAPTPVAVEAPVVAEAPVVVAAPVEVAVPAPAVVEVEAPVVVEAAPVVEVVAAIAEPAPAQSDAAARAQAAALKSYEELSAAAKDALDAVVASSEVLSQGLQNLGNTVYGLAQQSVDEGVALSKQLMAAKTMRELIDLQSAQVKAQLDRLLTEAPRLGDLSVKLVEDAVAPLNARVKAVVEKFTKPGV